MSEIVIYQDSNNQIELNVQLEGETVWLTQKQMSELFDTTPQNITMHLKSVFSEGELDEISTCKDFSQVRQEGNRKVKRNQRHYNLDAIISVGYKVKSQRATQFRIWATSKLRELLVQGYVVNQQRLEQKGQEVKILKSGIKILGRAIELKAEEEGYVWLDTFAKGFMKKHLYIFLVFLCLLFVNTLKSQSLISSQPDPPVVGDCLADGVVFYIFQPGDAGYVDGETHGLVVSLDQGLERWSCYGTDLPAVPNVLSGPTTNPETVVGSRIGDGKTNTYGVVQDCPNGNIAGWFQDKGSEWFLPSRGELNELYKWYAKDKPGNNNLMVKCGGVELATDWHWSSSDLDDKNAWGQYFSSGGEIYGVYKKTSGVLRAVRTF